MMESGMVVHVSQGILIDDATLDEIERLIVEIQNDCYASPVARQLLELECEIVAWQYRNELTTAEHDAIGAFFGGY